MLTGSSCYPVTPETMSKPLTAVALKALKCSERRREIPDPGCPNLYVVIQPSGVMSWALRCRVKGEPVKVTLGRVNLEKTAGTVPEMGGFLTLAEARFLAAQQRHLLAQGADPRETKAAAVAALQAAGEASEQLTVRAVVKAFLERHVKKEELRSASEIERQFKLHILPQWGDWPITDLSRSVIMERMDEIAVKAPVMANRVLATVRSMLSWAVSRSIVAANPAMGIIPPGAEKARDRVLTFDEIRFLWMACNEIGPPFGPLFKVLLATAQRREEVAGMRYSELDQKELRWLVPSARAKNGIENLVPLSSLVINLIKSSPRIEGVDGYVFTSTGETSVSGWSRAKSRLDAAMRQEMLRAKFLRENDELLHFTLHDLRRTAASHMARIGVQPHIIEATLNHKSGRVSGIAAVYNRYSYEAEKRAALNAWAEELERITGENEK
jgi:integrase